MDAFTALAERLGLPTAMLAVLVLFFWDLYKRSLPRLLAAFREELKAERDACAKSWDILDAKIQAHEQAQSDRHAEIMDELRDSRPWRIHRADDAPKPS